MDAIPIRAGTTEVELVVPMFAKDIVIDLLGTATETTVPMDITGYAVEFTFYKYDPQGKLLFTLCKAGGVETRNVLVDNVSTAMMVAVYVTDATVFDTVGKTVVTVTITLGTTIRTPNEELIFKILPNDHC
jgi:hypothetical protein